MKPKERIGIPEAEDRVLWICFADFGDVLESVADACNLKKRFPGIHLTFLTSPEYAELVRIQLYFDDVLVGRKNCAKWRQTVQKIKAGRYKWLVIDHQGGKASLMALFSCTKYRIGSCRWSFLKKYIYDIEMGLWFQQHEMNIKDRSRPAILASEDDRKTARDLLARLPERRLFAVIGSRRVGKMWTEEGWIEFLRSLVNKGWGVILNGRGPTEEAIGRQIENALASENVLNLIGALDVRKMSGIVSRCTMALGNDTGPLHIAALSGVPTMGLFNGHPHGAAVDLLNIPWFCELRAEDHVTCPRGGFPLKSLPASTVVNAFDAFAEEFLPRAFEWRDG